jgi:hypothetical protein
MSRFALQWLVPAEAERLTHIMLLDKDRPAPYVVAAGHGADKVEALLNLRVTLIENHAFPEAIDYVAVAYTRRTGQSTREGR